MVKTLKKESYMRCGIMKDLAISLKQICCAVH